MAKLNRCRVCHQHYKKQSITHKVCSIQCAIELTKLDKEKKANKAAKAVRKVLKEKLKTRSQWVKEAQSAWNRYVRLRDFGKPCCSCGSMPAQKVGGTMDCSHYRSTGAAPHLRFNLHNAAAACVKCNRHLSGNIVALRAGLIDRIGVEKVEALESNNETRKFDIAYLQRIKTIFGKKARRIEKILSQN